MTEDSRRNTPDFSALCQQANARAADWQSATDPEGPAAPAAFADRTRRSPLLKWGLVAGSCGLAMAVLAARLDQPPPPTHAAAQSGPTPQALPQSAPFDAADPIRWQGDELTIDLESVPLLQAVTWLAQATHSTVSGSEWLTPTQVSLHFRGRDVNAAWRQLLEGQAGVALACDAQACWVWIGGQADAPSTATRPATPPTAAQPAAGPADAAPSENESQPGGSC